MFYKLTTVVAYSSVSLTYKKENKEERDENNELEKILHSILMCLFSSLLPV